MATWVNISNSNLQPGAPARSVDVIALRDNPIAITEGAAGAPRIQTGALNDLAVTNAKIANATITGAKLAGNTVHWNRLETASIFAGMGSVAFGGIGSYMEVMYTGVPLVNSGATVSGASLTVRDGAGALSGTWRIMGRAVVNGGNVDTLAMRIA